MITPLELNSTEARLPPGLLMAHFLWNGDDACPIWEHQVQTIIMTTPGQVHQGLKKLWPPEPLSGHNALAFTSSPQIPFCPCKHGKEKLAGLPVTPSALPYHKDSCLLSENKTFFLVQLKSDRFCLLQYRLTEPSGRDASAVF